MDTAQPLAQGTRVSRFGCYLGYSDAIFDQFQRTSLYVPVRDGTRLAVDIYRPASNGIVLESPAPVVFTYSRYWRAQEEADGSVATVLGTLPPGEKLGPIGKGWGESAAHNLVRHGYVHVRAEARGTGASFGQHFGDMSGREAQDGYDLVEWIARQPWSTGRIGMQGHSYPGMSQHLAASTAPPHLVATFPGVAPFDEYDSSWSGTGILRKFGLAWLAREAQRDGLQEGVAGSSVNPQHVVSVQSPRVDEDRSGALRRAAREERRVAGADNPMRYFTVQSDNAATMLALLEQAVPNITIPRLIELLYSTEQLGALLDNNPELREKLLRLRFYRDASPMLREAQREGPNSLANLAPLISKAPVATYNWGGWFDFATRDTVLWHLNNHSPQRLTMGPWTHGWNEPDNPREDSQYALLMVEQLRWFDHWLKGVGNGIADEPPIMAAVMEDPQSWRWKSLRSWPPEGAEYHAYFLQANDGGLTTSPSAVPGSVRYAVDYGVSLGESTRYHDAIGMGPMSYPDLDQHAAQSLVFESAPLSDDLTILGHPIVELYSSSDAGDLEVNAYLEEIDADGNATLLSDGVIHSAHRVQGKPAYLKPGLLPHTDSRSAVVDATAELGETAELLRFDLHPTGVTFQRGHRIRLVIAGADAHTNLTIPKSPAPNLSIWSGGTTASRLLLPVID
jgi:predicted acyl esterase